MVDKKLQVRCSFKAWNGYSLIRYYFTEEATLFLAVQYEDMLIKGRITTEVSFENFVLMYMAIGDRREFFRRDLGGYHDQIIGLASEYDKLGYRKINDKVKENCYSDSDVEVVEVEMSDLVKFYIRKEE